MEPLIRVQGVKKSFFDKPVLGGIDLDILRGEILAILGESGSGKSVFLRTLIGLARADEGHIIFEERDIAQLSEKELRPVRRRMGLVFQEGALFDSLTVFENVAYPLREAEEPDDDVHEKVLEKLRMVGLEDAASKLPGELSGGMKKRVALARGLATQPEVLLYDEPTAGLDPKNNHRVTSLIREVRDRLGVTSVVVTHDVPGAFAIADRIALLADGKIAEIGDAESFARSESPAVRDFLDVGREARTA